MYTSIQNHPSREYDSDHDNVPEIFKEVNL